MVRPVDGASYVIPMARIDPAFAKGQLNLLLRGWYMHPNGQLPAYDGNFSGVNLPVHVWACRRVYKMTGVRGARDRVWLGSGFSKVAAQFHVVGEPKRSWWAAYLQRVNSGVGQHRSVRSLEATARWRDAGAGRRDGVDGVLLRHEALGGAGDRGVRPSLRGHRVKIF